MMEAVRNVCLVLALVFGGGCSVLDDAVTIPNGRIEHVVVCWLKDHGNATDRQKLIDTSYAFRGKIPGLLHVHAGWSLWPTTPPRPAVDTTCDVVIIMTFKDENAYMNYREHPLHQKAVKDVLQPLVQRYVIYDSMVEKK